MAARAKEAKCNTKRKERRLWDEDYTHRSLRQIFNFPASKAAKTKTQAHATRHNLNISLFGAELFIYDLVGPFTPLRHRP